MCERKMESSLQFDMRYRHPAQANQQHDANEHDGSTFTFAGPIALSSHSYRVREEGQRVQPGLGWDEECRGCLLVSYRPLPR